MSANLLHSIVADNVSSYIVPEYFFILGCALIYFYIQKTTCTTFKLPLPVLTTATCKVFFIYILQPAEHSLNNVYFFCILLGLVYIAFVDTIHFEIDRCSYFLIAIPTLFSLATHIPGNLDLVAQKTLSAAFVFVFLMLASLVVGIKHIGGADIKVLLILSFTVLFDFVFVYLFLCFIICGAIGLAHVIYRAIKNRYIPAKKRPKIRIPMLVAITFAWVFIQF